MKIDKTLIVCEEMAAALLRDYKKQIIEALIALDEDEKLTIGLSFALDPKSSTEFKVTGTLRFTALKIADKITKIVHEDQMDFGLDELQHIGEVQNGR